VKPVGLVACCKTKLGRPAPARELYQGTLFKLSVAWLEPRVDGWAILSAKHGVVMPDQVVEPYEQTLVGASRRAVADWNVAANMDLRTMFPGRRFLVIAGKAYMGALGGLDYTEAFAGLPLGVKLGKLTEALDG
jgi:hypothetical protein